MSGCRFPSYLPLPLCVCVCVCTRRSGFAYILGTKCSLRSEIFNTLNKLLMKMQTCRKVCVKVQFNGYIKKEIIRNSDFT